jgi:hypothetical protein
MSESANTLPAAMAAIEGRVHRLETRLDALAEAVEVLAHGLEDGPMAEPGHGRAREAARQAHELLLLTRPEQDAGS